MEGSSLEGSRLDGSRLEGSRFEGSRLHGSSLDGSRLDGSRLQGSRLEGSRLEGSTLEGSRLGVVGKHDPVQGDDCSVGGKKVALETDLEVAHCLPAAAQVRALDLRQRRQPSFHLQDVYYNYLLITSKKT